MPIVKRLGANQSARRICLAQENPTTICALDCYSERRYRRDKAFDAFKSSGELLQPHAAETIDKFLQCGIVDRTISQKPMS